MNAKEWAQLLDGREYMEELTRAEAVEAKHDGVVIVHGSSDDLMEFAGVISDELDAYHGTIAYLDETFPFFYPCYDIFCNDCSFYRCKKEEFRTIEALWCPSGVPGNPSWAYKTDIPHETFRIFEDGELYCIGIVFSVNDLTKRQEAGSDGQD